MSRAFLWLLIAALVAGCQPASPPPAGYVESCYGGDYANLNGSIPRVSVRIALTESQWPSLAASLGKFSSRQGLDYFDTTRTLDHVHALGLSVCSDRGIQIMAIDNVWRSHAEADADPSHTTVSLYRYNGYDSSAVEQALVSHLRSSYPDSVAGVQFNR